MGLKLPQRLPLTELLSHDTVLIILVAGGLINELRNPDGFGCREIVKDTREMLQTPEVRLNLWPKRGRGR
jgi:hypothetical protein